MSFLITYGESGEPVSEIIQAEATALARVVSLFEDGTTCQLWRQLPVKLTAKARIIKRKSPAPENPANPPSPTPEAGESPKKREYSIGLDPSQPGGISIAPVDPPGNVCLAPDCDEPPTESGFCKAHHINGVSPATVEALRKKRAASPTGGRR